jgi:hypothetical protein
MNFLLRHATLIHADLRITKGYCEVLTAVAMTEVCLLYPCGVHPVALCTRISFKYIPAIATEN